MSHPSRQDTRLSLRALSVGYGTKTVLKEIIGNISQGSFVSLLGPNGSGKTTLLKTLARLLKPLAGTVWLWGDPLEELSQRELARRQAVVLTERSTQGMMTAYELAALGRHPHTGFLGSLGPEDEHKTMSALGLVGAADLAHRYMDQLSDGERQKVMLARALAQEPRVILLDEPTLHLDLKHRLEVMSILHRLCRQRGITVVASMHDLDLATHLSDEVVLVRRGEVMAWGPPEVVLSQEAVVHLYELNGVAFSRELGMIAMHGQPSQDPVFVVAGGGTAATLLRLLAKRGYGLRCGVLPQNDVDSHLAEALGAVVVSEPPFEEVSPRSIKTAAALMAGTQAVVDTGFAVRTLNQGNLALLQKAKEMGKPLYSLRPAAEARALLKDSSGLVQCCADALELVERLGAQDRPPAPLSPLAPPRPSRQGKDGGDALGTPSS